MRFEKNSQSDDWRSYYQLEPTDQPPPWHMTEIDGEVLASTDDPQSADTTDNREEIGEQTALAERIDEIVVASLSTRTLTVNPGGEVTLQVTLLNNGRLPAPFRLEVESDLDLAWLAGVSQSIQLQPGEGSVLQVIIKPPRDASAEAGDYPLSVIASHIEQPTHLTQLSATLTITGYRDFAVGALQALPTRLSAMQRVTTVAVPISNLGNQPTRFVVSGVQEGQRYHYRINGTNATSGALHHATVLLAAGQTSTIYARVRPIRRHWLGLRPRQLHPQVAVSMADEARVPKVSTVTLSDPPLIGPGSMALAGLIFGLSLAALLALGMLLAGLWWLRQPINAAPTMLQAPAPAAPVIIVVEANQAVPVTLPTVVQQPLTNNPSTASALVSDPGNASALSALAPNTQAAAGIPVIGAEQVTAPNGQAPSVVVPAGGAQPGASELLPVTTVRPAAKTYAKMFQEIGVLYDLNWRMLAAQAYLESGFDSLAVGASGDRGLMQILPSTWREWAPKVGVSDPFEAESNALVAAAYLDYLRTLLSERGVAQVEWMLVAYNWGPDKVLDFLGSGGTWETLPAERKHYAEEIVRIATTLP